MFLSINYPFTKKDLSIDVRTNFCTNIEADPPHSFLILTLAPFSSKNPTLKGQVLVTPIRGYDAFHLKGVRVTVSPILI